MKSIWKYPLLAADIQTVSMPEDAQILSVQCQRGQPCLWALVDASTPPKDRVLHTLGTGHNIGADAESLRFIDTFQMAEGDLVFHIFEVED